MSSNHTDNNRQRERDRELVDRMRLGDDGALAEVVRTYQHRLYSLAYRLLENEQDALEVVQEAFIKVYRKIDSFRGRSAFYTWLYRITVNLCQDRRRQTAHRRKEVSLEQLGDQRGDQFVFEPVDSNTPGAHEVVANKELEERVYAAMEKLPEKQRTVVILREIEDLSYEEIAATVGVSLGTVMSRLHHARRKLQQELEPLLTTTDQAANRR